MVDQEKRNFYKILGVERTATQDDIKKAYRKAALENHPDRNPDKANADSRIKEINAAYETLGDEKKRKEYDLQGRNPFGNGGCFKNGELYRFFVFYFLKSVNHWMIQSNSGNSRAFIYIRNVKVCSRCIDLHNWKS